MSYKKVKDGVFLHPKLGRMVNHQGYSTAIHWSPAMLDYLKRNYARTLNDELAEWLGVSTRTMKRKADELGLKKNREWLLSIWNERRQMAHAAAAMKGYPGSFKKGQRANPAGEFKKGHRLTPELEEKRIEALKRHYLLNPSAAREKAMKAWQTRREKQAS